MGQNTGTFEVHLSALAAFLIYRGHALLNVYTDPSREKKAVFQFRWDSCIVEHKAAWYAPEAQSFRDYAEIIRQLGRQIRQALEGGAR